MGSRRLATLHRDVGPLRIERSKTHRSVTGISAAGSPATSCAAQRTVSNGAPIAMRLRWALPSRRIIPPSPTGAACCSCCTHSAGRMVRRSLEGTEDAEVGLAPACDEPRVRLRATHHLSVTTDSAYAPVPHPGVVTTQSFPGHACEAVCCGWAASPTGAALFLVPHERLRQVLLYRFHALRRHLCTQSRT